MPITHGGQSPSVPPARRQQSESDNPAGGSASVRTRRLREVARDLLGFEKFRPGQERAMQSVLAGRDTLAVLPSGAGKTAVYQVAGQLVEGPVLVVSPLIALQRDQVEDLAAGGTGGAAQLNSKVPAAERRRALAELARRGVVTVDAGPSGLTVAVINKYLELKSGARV